jgi:hypothetical protein
VKGKLVNVIDDTMRLELLKRLNLETDIRYQIAADQGVLASPIIYIHYIPCFQSHNLACRCISAFLLRNAAIFIKGKLVNVIGDIMRLHRLNLETDIGYQLHQGACITSFLYIIYYARNLIALLDVFRRFCFGMQQHIHQGEAGKFDRRYHEIGVVKSP